MTREAFIEKWQDELSGILLRAFSLVVDSEKAGHAPTMTGPFMLKTIKSLEKLLARMYEDKQPSVKQLAADEIVELFMEHYLKLSPSEGEEIKKKLRTKLNGGK